MAHPHATHLLLLLLHHQLLHHHRMHTHAHAHHAHVAHVTHPCRCGKL